MSRSARAVDAHGINMIFITGDAMARPMLDALKAGHPATGEPYQHTSLWAMASSAALFSPALKDEYIDLLPNTVITDSIGSSEISSGMDSETQSAVAKGCTMRGQGSVMSGILHRHHLQRFRILRLDRPRWTRSKIRATHRASGDTYEHHQRS